MMRREDVTDQQKSEPLSLGLSGEERREKVCRYG